MWLAMTSCASRYLIFLQNFEVTQILDDLFTSHESIFIREWTFASKELV
jgi:hypothetical protein